MITMSMRQEDVLWSVLVADEESGVEEEVEFGDDEGGVPCSAGAAEEGQILERLGEFEGQNWGRGGLRNWRRVSRTRGWL